MCRRTSSSTTEWLLPPRRRQMVLSNLQEETDDDAAMLTIATALEAHQTRISEALLPPPMSQQPQFHEYTWIQEDERLQETCLEISGTGAAGTGGFFCRNYHGGVCDYRKQNDSSRYLQEGLLAQEGNLSRSSSNTKIPRLWAVVLVAAAAVLKTQFR